MPPPPSSRQTGKRSASCDFEDEPPAKRECNPEDVLTVDFNELDCAMFDDDLASTSPNTTEDDGLAHTSSLLQEQLQSEGEVFTSQSGIQSQGSNQHEWSSPLSTTKESYFTSDYVASRGDNCDGTTFENADNNCEDDFSFDVSSDSSEADQSFDQDSNHDEGSSNLSTTIESYFTSDYVASEGDNGDDATSDDADEDCEDDGSDDSDSEEEVTPQAVADDVHLIPRQSKRCPFCGQVPSAHSRLVRSQQLGGWKIFRLEGRSPSAEEERCVLAASPTRVSRPVSRYISNVPVCFACRFPMPQSPLAAPPSSFSTASVSTSDDQQPSLVPINPLPACPLHSRPERSNRRYFRQRETEESLLRETLIQEHKKRTEAAEEELRLDALLVQQSSDWLKGFRQLDGDTKPSEEPPADAEIPMQDVLLADNDDALVDSEMPIQEESASNDEASVDAEMPRQEESASNDEFNFSALFPFLDMMDEASDGTETSDQPDTDFMDLWEQELYQF